MTIVKTTVDCGSVLAGDNIKEDAPLLFPAADSYVAGTLLGRQIVNPTITATLTGTGTHVLTVAARAGRSLQTGTWSLLAGTLTSGVGAWTLTAPDGQTETLTTTSKTAAMNFPRLGMSITPAAAGNDFVTGDSASIPVAAPATMAYVIYSPTGTNGAQNPVGVLIDQVDSTGAATKRANVCIGGKVNGQRLVIDADGNNSNITPAIKDQLRAASIAVIDQFQRSLIDN